MNKPKGLKATMLSNIYQKKDETSVQEEMNNEEEVVGIEEKRTFSIPQSIIEKIERNAYWDHKTLKEVIVDILETHYISKTYEPIPITYKKPKRGKPKKKIT